MRFGVMRSVTKVPVIRHIVAVILGELASVGCIFHGFRPVSPPDTGHLVHAISATLGAKRRRTLHCYSGSSVVVKLSFVLRMDSPLRLSR